MADPKRYIAVDSQNTSDQTVKLTNYSNELSGKILSTNPDTHELEDVRDIFVRGIKVNSTTDIQPQNGILNISTVAPSPDAAGSFADAAETAKLINEFAGFYITKDGTNAFQTNHELMTAETVYSGTTERTPTRNDYAIVAKDETHGNATTRYVYQGTYGDDGQWAFQYVVNEESLTQAQIAAINSGITSDGLSSINNSIGTLNGSVSALNTNKVEKIDIEKLSADDTKTLGIILTIASKVNEIIDALKIGQENHIEEPSDVPSEIPEENE